MVQAEHVAELVPHHGREVHAVRAPAPAGGVDVDGHDAPLGRAELEVGQVRDVGRDTAQVGARVRGAPVGDGCREGVVQPGLGEVGTGDWGRGCGGRGQQVSAATGHRAGAPVDRARDRRGLAVRAADGGALAAREGACEGGQRFLDAGVRLGLRSCRGLLLHLEVGRRTGVAGRRRRGAGRGYRGEVLLRLVSRGLCGQRGGVRLGVRFLLRLERGVQPGPEVSQLIGRRTRRRSGRGRARAAGGRAELLLGADEVGEPGPGPGRGDPHDDGRLAAQRGGLGGLGRRGGCVGGVLRGRALTAAGGDGRPGADADEADDHGDRGDHGDRTAPGDVRTS